MSDASGEKPSANSLKEKICSRCQLPKPTIEFHKNNQHRDGLQGYCKSCQRDADNTAERKTYRDGYYKTHRAETKKRSHTWAQENRFRVAKNGRAYHYKKYFNLTEEQVQRIVDHQHGCCAMCGRPLLKPNIDHDHKTGLVRGALCWPCNRLLGLAHDNPERLNQGIIYLSDPPATQALGGPHYGLPGRVGTKKQRKLAKKLAKLQQTS